MTPASPNELAAGLLMLWVAFLVAAAILFSLAFTGFHRSRRPKRPVIKAEEELFETTFSCLPPGFDTPHRWLAVRSGNPSAIQEALGLDNPTPCSWGEGVVGLLDQKLFIAPPIHGWVVVMGQGLPDPSEDIDRFFRFMVRLSTELGHVQFFSAQRAISHHAWVKSEGGRIIRAYAWGDTTLWDQGVMTSAENDLEMKCVPYAEEPEIDILVGSADSYRSNSDKVALLAGRWSLDPFALDAQSIPRQSGIVGELSHSKRF